MLETILRKLVLFFEKNNALQHFEENKILVNKAKIDLKQHKHINFYAVDAEKQINDMFNLIEFYLKKINKLIVKLEKTKFNNETPALIDKLSSIIYLLNRKKTKLTQLNNEIPEGMLDVKRAISITMNSSLSLSLQEDAELKRHFNSLKRMMAHLNDQYNLIIQQGGCIDSILLNTTILYWSKLEVYSNSLKIIYDFFNKCHELTSTGQLALRCLYNALTRLPSEELIHHALVLLKNANADKFDTYKFIKKIGFYSSTSRKACLHLIHLGKVFFHLPHNEDLYHFDYNPRDDILGTGGNCYGEAMVFIHALTRGKFKRLCPEPGLINFQLDQTNQLKFKKVIGRGETPVSAESKYNSLQWADVRSVLLDNPVFKAGDLCGFIFAMNDYSKSKTQFTPRHISVIVKLDTHLCPYKYIVFEKELGVFGLVDDDSFEFIIDQHLLPLYKNMHYSQIELIKYGEATQETYQLLRTIKSININPLELSRLNRTNPSLFFNEQEHTTEKQEKNFCYGIKNRI